MPGQEEQAPEEGVQKDGEATSVEKASSRLRPLRGFQELIKVPQVFLREYRDVPASDGGIRDGSAALYITGLCHDSLSMSSAFCSRPRSDCLVGGSSKPKPCYEATLRARGS